MKKLSCLFILIGLFFNTAVVSAQGIGINATGAAPDPSASLDVSGTTKGVLINRMTQTQRDAISNPALGLQIFNTTTNCINMWVGNTWKQSCFDCDFSAPVAGNNGPVCQGTTLNLTATYIAGATYQWTGPNGFSSTDQNPVINNVSGFANGTYTVTATKNGCTSQQQFTTVTIYTTPSSLGASNNGPLCGSGILDLISNVVSGAVYNWTGPANFTSTAQNPVINYVTSTNAGTYYVTTTTNGCVSPVDSTILVIVNGTPLQPNAITGNTINLGGQNDVSYSVNPVNLASYYVWTVPNGVTLASGQGSTGITANFTCSGDGYIGITANNACGTSPQQNLYVSTDVVAPGSITGSTIVCPNTSQTYSIAAVPYATGYTWSVPDGASITSGQNTTTVTVNVGTASGNISVTETSSCGTSSPSVLTIYNAIPSFNFNPSAGIVGGVQVTFTPVSNFPGITYSWTFDQGTPSSSTSQNPVVTWPAQLSQTSFTAQLSVNGCPGTSNQVPVAPGASFSASGSGQFGSPQTFTVPVGITSLTISAYGAQGGLSPDANTQGGLGAFEQGTFNVTPGDVLTIRVGQQGVGYSVSGGGGGSSGVLNQDGNTLLIVAGGGGGSGYNYSNYSNSTYPFINAVTGNNGQSTYGCGGGSLLGNGGSGGSGGQSGTNPCGDWPQGAGGAGVNSNGQNTYGNGDCTGGQTSGNGGDGSYGGAGGYGYTGGGGSSYGGGGGGGYSGGAGGASASGYIPGGGGGSYNAGSSQSSSAAFQSGNGQVVISY